MLSGYKTYITAGVAVITAIASFLIGDMGAADALQIGFTALMGAFIRNGVKSDTTA